MRAIRPRGPLAALITALCAIGVAGCASKPPQARRVDPPVNRDVPAVLRGTVGGLATLERARPALVSGYGLVVGLNGTGGGDLDPALAATMERMLGLNEVGKNADAFAGTPLEGKTPREVLRSRDVAVVVVYAAVIPGAPVYASFDCYVSAVNRSPEVSLEGGTLWSTDLHMGPPTAFGQVKTKGIARAWGPVFINPFAAPGVRDGFGRADGRILSGGMITGPLPLQLVLDNESHSRAGATAEAINRRFIEQPGEGPTARGRTARIIDITVPAAYRDRPQDFLSTLTHIQTDATLPQEYARRYVQALREQPAMADELSWCLQALPEKAALPFLRPLYDDPEITPRMAALRAGSALGDALAAPALKQLARSGPPTLRPEAIRLLGGLAAGPTVDVALKEQLASGDLAVRVAAYEALAERAEKLHIQRLLAMQERGPANARVVNPGAVQVARAQMDIPGDLPQGVKRRSVEGKFILDIVPGGSPLMYVTQQGRPRVVLFGDSLEVSRPTLVSAWGGKAVNASLAEGEPPNAAANGAAAPSLWRLMLVAESPTDQPRLMYRYPDRADAEGHNAPGRLVSSKVSSKLPELIEFLAHTPTPEDPRPGLGMSYSEVVGALNEFQKGGAIAAPLAIEEDLLRLRLLNAANQVDVEDRPENAAQAAKVRVYEPVTSKVGQEPPKPAEKPDLVVPLERPSKDGKKK